MIVACTRSELSTCLAGRLPRSRRSSDCHGRPDCRRWADFRKVSRGRVVWNFSSTATGGGVADMLQVLVGYTKDLAVDVRWLVIGGDTEFFRITKRLHNRIHGESGDGGALGECGARARRAVMSANVDSVGDRVGAGDLVLLHDPQTAGLVGPLARRGAHVVWRSHIGIDGENEVSRSAWAFLQPLLADAEAFVFTRASYVPSIVPPSRTWIIPPSIDPFSPKNQPMDPSVVRPRWSTWDCFRRARRTACRYTRRDGSPGEVEGTGVRGGGGAAGAERSGGSAGVSLGSVERHDRGHARVRRVRRAERARRGSSSPGRRSRASRTTRRVRLCSRKFSPSGRACRRPSGHA